MRACALTAAVCFVFCGAPDVHAQPPGAQQFIVLGCVNREAPARGAKPGTDTFSIRDPRGEGTTYRLDGDPEILRLHVGRTVEVAGPLTPAPASAGAGALATIKVDKLTYIAPNCIYGASK